MPVPQGEDTFIITGCLWLRGPVSFLWAVPNTHCQSLFSLSPVYLKWPRSKSWPFLSSDVLILWIKLCSWSQSSSCSSRPRRNVNVISSVLAGESYSLTYMSSLEGVEGASLLPLFGKKSQFDFHCYYSLRDCDIFLHVIEWDKFRPHLILII